MKYISLFSGIGGFEVGLEDLGWKCAGFSEIAGPAIDIYRHHFPDHPALGDVSQVHLPEGLVDLLVAGFPCTDLSIANIENKGLDGQYSGLIYQALRLMQEAKPTYFLIENVASMKRRNTDLISDLLGVQPVRIDASLLGPQLRDRYFWANFPITVPARVASPPFRTLLLEGPDSTLNLSAREVAYMDRAVKGGRTHWDFRHHHDTNDDKAHCLPANLHKGVPYNVLLDSRNGTPVARKLAPIEAERLMGFPDHWTALGASGKPISTTQRLKALGNSVDIRVVRHIAMCLQKHIEAGGGPTSPAPDAPVQASFI